MEIRQVVASLAGGGDNSGVADCASNMLLVEFLHLTRGSVDPEMYTSSLGQYDGIFKVSILVCWLFTSFRR